MPFDNSATPIILLHFPATLIVLCSTTMCAGGDALINGEYPWTYDNDLFGGPDFWGLMHKHWRMCKLGALQSPINIDPTKLIFDPQLGRLRIAPSHVEAQLWNMGQFPLLTIMDSNKNSSASSRAIGDKHNKELMKQQQQPLLNIAGGPAHPYTFQMQQIVIHFGDVQKGERGSEHTIDRVRFPAEVQLLAFNSDLYDNFTQAQSQPKGLLGIAIIVDIGDTSNPELHRLSQATKHVKHRNQMVRIRRFQPAALLPQTEHYVTYDGSMTYPGCFETVTWVLMNTPIYISIEDLAHWAQLVQSEPAESEAKADNGTPPPVPLSSNYRPLKASNGRAVRTNINMRLKSVSDGGQCPSRMYVDMGYRTNPARRADKMVPSASSSDARRARRHEEQQQSRMMSGSAAEYQEEKRMMMDMELDEDKRRTEGDKAGAEADDAWAWTNMDDDEHNLASSSSLLNCSLPIMAWDKHN